MDYPAAELAALNCIISIEISPEMKVFCGELMIHVHKFQKLEHRLSMNWLLSGIIECDV